MPSRKPESIAEHLTAKERVALFCPAADIGLNADSQPSGRLGGAGPKRGTVHDGTEGELYDLADDPLQRVNRWTDPACAATRAELLERLDVTLPERRGELAPVVANV